MYLKKNRVIIGFKRKIVEQKKNYLVNFAVQRIEKEQLQLHKRKEMCQMKTSNKQKLTTIGIVLER